MEFDQIWEQKRTMINHRVSTLKNTRNFVLKQMHNLKLFVKKIYQFEFKC